MELQEDAENLDLESEHQLSTKPMQSDVRKLTKYHREVRNYTVNKAEAGIHF